MTRGKLFRLQDPKSTLNYQSPRMDESLNLQLSLEATQRDYFPPAQGGWMQFSVCLLYVQENRTSGTDEKRDGCSSIT